MGGRELFCQLLSFILLLFDSYCPLLERWSQPSLLWPSSSPSLSHSFRQQHTALPTASLRGLRRHGPFKSRAGLGGGPRADWWNSGPRGGPGRWGGGPTPAAAVGIPRGPREGPQVDRCAWGGAWSALPFVPAIWLFTSRTRWGGRERGGKDCTWEIWAP